MQLDLALGVVRRDAGIARVTINNATWIERMRSVARELEAQHGAVSADDLRAYCTTHDFWPMTPQAWGGLFASSDWELIERRASRLPSANARWIGVYRLRREIN